MWKVFLGYRDAGEVCLFYLKIIVFTVFIFSNVINQSKCQEPGRGMRGADCINDKDCDQSRSLRCTGADSTCDCHYKVGEVWVTEENSCMIKEGAPCGRMTSTAKCITNSSCTTGKCECDDGYLRDGFMSCQLGYDSPCTENNCAGRYILSCTQSEEGTHSVCKCSNEGKDFVWDDDRERCVRPAGGKCDLPGSSEYEMDNRIECIDYADCVNVAGNGVCQCKLGFAQTPESNCMLQHGERCESGGPKCNKHQFLNCEQGKCACEFHSQMKYDNATKQCRWLVSESCEVNVSDLKEPLCVTDSSCIPRHGYHRGICTCLPNVEKMDDRTCSRYNKGHGLPCSTSIDCDRRKFLECVPDENVGSRCDCLQSDMYFDGKICRVRAGRSCTENKLCANNSYCEGNWCVCEGGYKIGDVHCITEVGSKARNLPNAEPIDQYLPEISCDDFYEGSEEWIRCNDCQAKSLSHVWINEKRSCLALVGINCLRDSDCFPDAICDVQEKTCQCPAVTHTTSKDRTCIVRSLNPTKSVDSHHFECTEIQTLKSIRSQEYESQSRANNAQSYTSFIIVIISFLWTIVH